LSYVVSVDFIWFALTAATLFVYRRRDVSARELRSARTSVDDGILHSACTATVLGTISNHPVDSAIGFAILLAVPAFRYWQRRR
jgi:APA family basic amino acid/polyamine antiporter